MKLKSKNILKINKNILNFLKYNDHFVQNKINNQNIHLFHSSKTNYVHFLIIITILIK